MTDPSTPEPDVTDEEAAEFVAFLDGTLPADRVAAVQARLEADPALAAAFDRRRRFVDVVGTALAATEAPHDLRLRLESTTRTPERRPRPRRRWLPFGATAGALAAAIVAIVIAAGGGGLTVTETASAALRPPTARTSIDTMQPALLREQAAAVRFPNFARRFGWKAVGARTDELEGRKMRTVFYERRGERIAYTIVEGEALEEPGKGSRTTIGGVALRSLRHEGRQLVTWRRQGHTCVLSGEDVSARTLLELAAWRGQGAVKF